MRFKVWLEKSETGTPMAHPAPKGEGKPEIIKRGTYAKSVTASKGDDVSKTGVPSNPHTWSNYTQSCQHGLKKDGSCQSAGDYKTANI